MKKPKIGLIDYDMGNLRSVSKALEKAGCSVVWADRPALLRGCDGLVLPGVGAFAVAVRNLKKRGLFAPIREWIEAGRPFLGICLGYQLLFEGSEEGGGKKLKGLAVFKGKVRRLPNKGGLKVPHIGWNGVEMQASCAAPALRGLADGAYFYFVHSYVPDPKDREIVATRSRYGIPFASSVARGALFASQFHPEKSGDNGLKLLGNFARLAAAA